jgi:hypothetical protein
MGNIGAPEGRAAGLGSTPEAGQLDIRVTVGDLRHRHIDPGLGVVFVEDGCLHAENIGDTQSLICVNKSRNLV